MIRIIRYTKLYKKEWDAFCQSSLNGIFLFYRDYMDYHSDRFCDHSLLFYKENRLIALLPCNERTEKSEDAASAKILSSHDGLTFGSFIMGAHTHQTDMLDCVEALIEYCREEGIREVYFKPVPLLLQRIPSEQDVYALIRHGAELIRSDPSTATCLRDYTPNCGEKRKCRLAASTRLLFRCCQADADWEKYHDLLTSVLNRRHGVDPVHSLSELLQLRDCFPDNIKLFAVFNESKMLAGAVVYEYNKTIHIQYMASNEEGRRRGALHFCLQKLIEHCNNKEWLDLGISTEDQGKVLNRGLIQFKEGFRGNTMIYNKWLLRIK